MTNEEDLHSGKDSHASLPIAHGMEFHLRNHDVKHDCKVGEKYYVCVPVEVTSKDEDMTRFKQLSMLEVEPYEEESSEDKIRNAAKKTYKSKE